MTAGAFDLAAAAALYVGRVRHERLKPVHHALSYRVFNVLLDVDRLDGVARGLRLFSHNRPGLTGIRDRDLGARDGTAPGAWVRSHLQAAGLAAAGHTIRMLCYPRVLGYVFNPLTVYYCHRQDGDLGAVLYHVANTFGEQHGYLVPVPGGHDPARPLHHSADKRFYVSPFFPVDGAYDFRLKVPGDRLTLSITYRDHAGPRLVATVAAERRPMSDGQIARVLVSHPALTVKVIGGIHWEALKLWRKRVAFIRRPAPPENPVTVVGSPADH